jgi:hypothetical protein
MINRWCITILMSLSVTACPFLCLGGGNTAVAEPVAESACACCRRCEKPARDSRPDPAERHPPRPQCDCFCKGAVVLRQEAGRDLFDHQVCPLGLAIEGLKLTPPLPRKSVEGWTISAFPPLSGGRSMRALISSLTI